MPNTSAEPQVAYRLRLRERTPETLEVGIERERQAILAEWAAELDAEENAVSAALVRDVASRPARTGVAFTDWLTGLLVHDIEDELASAKRAASKGGWRTMA